MIADNALIETLYRFIFFPLFSCRFFLPFFLCLPHPAEEKGVGEEWKTTKADAQLPYERGASAIKGVNKVQPGYCELCLVG